MRNSIKLALQNIVKHGDTDIFPFPFENHVFFDDRKKISALLLKYHKHFEEYLSLYPPRHFDSLAPAGYNGFRWVTQLDPIWNAYFLACVLAIADKIENKRIAKNDEVVFSYRLAPDLASGDLFDREYNWTRFMRRSLSLSELYEYVVICDISEFYPRIGHHRLENALKHLGDRSDIPHRIMEFLKNFSNTRSFGLPIGGPAARILSELTLDQIDRLLKLQGIEFVRYADDYHLFANDKNHAYQQLVFLSEKLYMNQGLSLQKSKTRIVTTSEFNATSPIKVDEEANDDIEGILPPRSLFGFPISFDPYSPTATDDYERLKSELARFDIMGLLRSELQKSRIHAALSRRIVQAVRFLDEGVRDDAVRSILGNAEILYPIFSSVLILLEKIFDELSEDTQNYTVQTIRQLIADKSAIMGVDIHLSFAIRVLAHKGDETTQALLQQVYDGRTSPLIRRDIILAMAKWGEWHWLSDLRNRFRELSDPEKRAFVVASYTLQDEGSHWRKHVKKELSPFDELIRQWAGRKSQARNWEIPL